MSQTLKAAKALLKHIANDDKVAATKETKQTLIGDDEDESTETPIWLALTTKKHIVDARRLKPGKITLPHPINTSATQTICLITADPQRTYKDLVAHPSFPAELRSRITRVIGVQKVKAKYSQYEAQRQLRAEHDLFIADDRIITQLPKLLGKTFYKNTAKRPIPVNMQAPAPRSEGKRIARAKGVGAERAVIEPAKLAKEIQKTLDSALIALAPSTQTSVRVALAGWKAEEVAANVESVAKELIDKFVPQKWRGVRALHIKGPNTAAMPIWLADELWTDEKDVLAEPTAEELAAKAEEVNAGNKRKRAAGEDKDAKKVKNEVKPESDDKNLEKEIAERKEKLKKQKAAAAESVVEEVSVPKNEEAKKEVKKTKKRKSVA